jgi:hypothetical protein
MSSSYLTKSCFGEYKDTEDCRHCWQSSPCKDEAQALDNYWDEMSRYQWELITEGAWEYSYDDIMQHDSRLA